MRTLTRIIPLFFMLALLGGCFGSDTDTTADPATNNAGQQQATQPVSAGTVEITVGMAASQVTKVLGAADSVGTDAKGRETWFYERKQADYAYAAKGGQSLIIDNYSSGSGRGASLNITITLDKSRKVADFSYQQMGY